MNGPCECPNALSPEDCNRQTLESPLVQQHSASFGHDCVRVRSGFLLYFFYLLSTRTQLKLDQKGFMASLLLETCTVTAVFKLVLRISRLSAPTDKLRYYLTAVVVFL